MKLIVHELLTKLSQVIQIGDSSINLEAIRPHLYRHNQAAGSLRIQIEDLTGSVIALGETIAISQIPLDRAFWHGYIRFYVKAFLKAGASYQVSVVALDGYSFSDDAYIGWCKDFDLRKVPALYSPSSEFHAAMDMEFWSLQDVSRGDT